MAVPGKGGNRGRPPKYNPAPATLKSGARFTHSKPLQPLSGNEIKLKKKYRQNS